jgi:hypothetical protein
MNQKLTLSQEEITLLGITHTTNRNRYRLTSEQIEKVYEHRGLRDENSDGILEACSNVGVAPKDVKMIWLKTKSESVRVENPYYEEKQEREVVDILDNFLTKFEPILKPININAVSEKRSGLFDRLVFTDTHIGMTPNEDGYSLYGGKWDAEEVSWRLAEIVNHAISNQKSNTLYIDDLGDFFDGFDGKTVRREHDLPQNMDNQKAFDVGFEFKRRMIESLLRNYDKIICHNVCESNHSSSFDYIVNSAIKVYMEKCYEGRVEVVNHRRFIEHYNVGKYIFILTHGKDSKCLKFGFKPHLDAIQEGKINNYIDEHYLLQSGSIIEFSKGDSHQYLFDNSTSDRFNYYNYPALSPSSNWVQTGFKKGKSGIVFFNYSESGKSINELFFNWKR